MTEYELLVAYRNVESQLLLEGYKVNPVNSGFFVTHEGQIISEIKSVEGLRGFLEGVQWQKVLKGTV